MRHNYIQRLFPLWTPSKNNFYAPVWNDQTVQAFSGNNDHLDKMKSALGRMTQFFNETTKWKQESDHNHLRITRIITALCTVGLVDEAKAFFNNVNVEGPSSVSKTIWANALATGLQMRTVAPAPVTES